VIASRYESGRASIEQDMECDRAWPRLIEAGPRNFEPLNCINKPSQEGVAAGAFLLLSSCFLLLAIALGDCLRAVRHFLFEFLRQHNPAFFPHRNTTTQRILSPTKNE